MTPTARSSHRRPPKPDPWLPGAIQVPAFIGGGAFTGNAGKAVWIALGLAESYSARLAAHYLNTLTIAPHVVWDPFTGHLVQLIPATQAARYLQGPLNRDGSPLLQIAVLGPSPFTQTPCVGLGKIVDWLRSHEIPDVFPEGPPAPIARTRASGLWSAAGHYGLSQVPHMQLPNPGAVDVRAILSAGDGARGSGRAAV